MKTKLNKMLCTLMFFSVVVLSAGPVVPEDLGKIMEAEGPNGNLVEVKRKNVDVCTASILALSVGRSKAIELFTNGVDDFSNKKKINSSPLVEAADNGHVKVVKTLLKHGAKVDQENRYGRTALMVAAYRGHVEIVEILIEYGANVR